MDIDVITSDVETSRLSIRQEANHANVLRKYPLILWGGGGWLLSNQSGDTPVQDIQRAEKKQGEGGEKEHGSHHLSERYLPIAQGYHEWCCLIRQKDEAGRHGDTHGRGDRGKAVLRAHLQQRGGYDGTHRGDVHEEITTTLFASLDDSLFKSRSRSRLWFSDTPLGDEWHQL